jgi:hypothetical protein
VSLLFKKKKSESREEKNGSGVIRVEGTVRSVSAERVMRPCCPMKYRGVGGASEVWSYSVGVEIGLSELMN